MMLNTANIVGASFDKSIFSWSSGKDSAIALYEKLNTSKYQSLHLTTTINKDLERVTMHGLRKALVIKQLSSIGLPYSFIELPEQPSMDLYEEKQKAHFNDLKNKGYSSVGFGDIFLEDLRQYRNNLFASIGIGTYYPLWKRNTRDLIQQFFDLGFRAIVVSCNDELGENFVGQELTPKIIESLPKNIDPCGENGEFHTFCFDGPIFNNSIDYEKGDKVLKKYKHNGVESGFWFCDLI